MWKDGNLMTTNQPLLLFISSKMDELQEERYAVQMALAAYRMYGWLWEQDAGARPESIQSTYLKEVEACDIYIGLFGNGYGKYTIEEFQHARKHHKPCLIYEKQANIEQRDPQLRDFLAEINHITDGLTVYRFGNAEQLATQVQKDVIRFLTSRFRATRQQPIWNIPFPRKEFFVGRKALLKQLHTRLQTTRMATLGQRQVLNGLGGIGKTQLAVEYAYQYRQEYQSVLWAHADTTETLNTSYTEIARLLKLPQQDAQEQEIIVQGVKDWLSSQQNWLLILDNADEPDVLIPFLPPKVGGHLIVTTRAGDMSYLGLGFGHALTVEKFTKNQSVSFLLQRAGLKRVSSQDREYAQHIANELDGLPLALNQAGVYLARTRSSLDSYWKMYQQQGALLLDIHEDREYPRSVAATLLLSFKRVEQRNPAAADLLRLCAFLAPDAIPEELLTKGARELGDVLAPVAEDAYQLNQAFADLRAYSLLTRDPQSRTLTAHRLVQAVLRDNMSTKEQCEWMRRVVVAINMTLSGIEFEDWPVYERLLPHVTICATWTDCKAIVTLEASHVFRNTGVYLRERGQYSEAEALLKKALTLREQLLGPDHSDTAGVLNNLASVYWRQGKLELAELLYLRALDIREKQLGTNHLDTAAVLSNLSLLYWQQKEYERAEPLAERALFIREQQLEVNYHDIAISMNNLANLYDDEGKYEQAERFYLQALTIWEQRSGIEHPNTAQVLNNLAEFYQKQQQYERAESFYQRALAIFEQQLGAEHPNTAYPLHGLAELYRLQGKPQQAEYFYQRAFAIRKRLGPNNSEAQETQTAYIAFLHSIGRDVETTELATKFEPYAES
jgi:tetratricopeptide (TPR) repeat protein